MPTGKRARAARSPTPVSDEDMDVQKMFSQEQEKPKKKRNVRKIPGRFTALDSSDEEEDQRNYDLKIVSTNCQNAQGLFVENSRNRDVDQVYLSFIFYCFLML
jgi:hypothetical protein